MRRDIKRDNRRDFKRDFRRDRDRDSGRRIFVGVFLPKEWQEKLEKYQKAFPSIRGMKWVKPSNSHLTLLFIGPVKESKVPAVKLGLDKLVKRVAPFEMEFDRFTYALPGVEPTMIWAQFKPCSEFGFLANDIKKMVQQLTVIDTDVKKSLPHVTLARMKDMPQMSHINANMKDTKLKVDTIYLMSTKLTRDNSEFTVLGEYKLTKGEDEKQK